MTNQMKYARFVVELPNLYRELFTITDCTAAPGLMYGFALSLMTLAEIRDAAERGDLEAIKVGLAAIGIPKGFASEQAAHSPVRYSTEQEREMLASTMTTPRVGQ